MTEPQSEDMLLASHSQLSSWLRCGKAFYLERKALVPQTPAVYLLAGNAMHAVVETMNRDWAAAAGVVEVARVR